ncbi:beta-ketoacyl-[acyl-carrier-protein] synthase family protein [Actinomadura barringtoniae]|uniref:Beta-ketoacyl-[acyl-carrier-protein] synthase family protein n=1 Tax=Actinomadura barringtoniae TaxID=1427535 RepID=A0A939PIR0_9ACTN|nr:beta-ketoacyl-[acyl-carrier-protein] synthase family protein [Actinomadura barringtoniae]MBO2450813.1 beta-ketoacyl-[acyl-carrier-protein] synthase family protein [Actinomadura barringtoniae]
MQRPDGTPRVVVTGMGVRSPAGNDPSEAYATVTSGKGQAAHLPELLDAGLPVTFGCAVRDFESGLSKVERRRLDRAAQLAIAAADEAITAAGPGFSGDDPLRRGTYVGTASANLASIIALGGHEHAGTLNKVPVPTVPTIMANAAAAQISIRHGHRGPCLTLAAACASGATALGEAALAIRSGRIDAAIAGGVDALLTPFVVAAFARLGALSRRREDPGAASRPFDPDQDGFVMGEGAAFLTLERADRAAARGARIYGEISGYAAASDGAHIVTPREDGLVAAECMRRALEDADLGADEIGHVNAHATATPANDNAEVAAIERFFASSPPVTATKGVTGHLLGACGAFEAVIALMSAADGLVPPTANFTGGTDRIDVVHGGPREIPVAPVLSNSFGFGGHHASLVLTPP